MKDCIGTLMLISTMLKDAPNPTQYQIIPRELILRSTFDWATLYSQLLELQTEGYIHVTDADGIKFSITQEGLDFAFTLAENSSRQEVTRD